MDVNMRIKKIMDERGWSEYRLAKEAQLSQSTIANLFKRNTTPSISTLELICSAFGITLAQFFSENNLVELTEEQKLFFQKWTSLTVEQKKIFSQLIDNMK